MPKKETTKKYTGWILLNDNKDPLVCDCHPSKRLSYVIYKRKNSQFANKYWKKITFEI